MDFIKRFFDNEDGHTDPEVSNMIILLIAAIAPILFIRLPKFTGLLFGIGVFALDCVVIVIAEFLTSLLFLLFVCKTGTVVFYTSDGNVGSNIKLTNVKIIKPGFILILMVSICYGVLYIKNFNSSVSAGILSALITMVISSVFYIAAHYVLAFAIYLFEEVVAFLYSKKKINIKIVNETENIP